MKFSTKNAKLAEAKRMAREIRLGKARAGQAISHSQALELVAQSLGHRNWNTAVAALFRFPDVSIQVGDHIRGTYLKQPFTGRVLSLTEKGGGKQFRLSVDLDEAVDVVTFDSFSAWRKRVHGQISRDGVSFAKTSDGEPHLRILGHAHT